MAQGETLTTVGERPLFNAAFFGHYRFCQFLRGETPLHRAAAFGNGVSSRILLDAGATIDAKDANGETPLGWASWHRRPAAILSLPCYGQFVGTIRPVISTQTGVVTGAVEAGQTVLAAGHSVYPFANVDYLRHVPNYRCASDVDAVDAERLDRDTFLRRFVNRNRPCLVRAAARHCGHSRSGKRLSI
jgi:hypothetical protein